MANPFGEVVDDESLDEILRYNEKPKSQEDRAREAMKQKDDGAESNPRTYLQQLGTQHHAEYVRRTHCLVYNATGETLSHVTYHDWDGVVGRTPYPTEMENGQFGAFLHINKSTDVYSASMGAVVYRGKNKDGHERDILIAWANGVTTGNKVYCDVGAVDGFPPESSWRRLYSPIMDSGSSRSVEKDGFKVNVAIGESGGTPLLRSTLTVPFDP